MTWCIKVWGSSQQLRVTVTTTLSRAETPCRVHRLPFAAVRALSLPLALAPPHSPHSPSHSPSPSSPTTPASRSIAAAAAARGGGRRRSAPRRHRVPPPRIEEGEGGDGPGDGAAPRGGPPARDDASAIEAEEADDVAAEAAAEAAAAEAAEAQAEAAAAAEAEAAAAAETAAHDEMEDRLRTLQIAVALYEVSLRSQVGPPLARDAQPNGGW